MSGAVLQFFHLILLIGNTKILFMSEKKINTRESIMKNRKMLLLIAFMTVLAVTANAQQYDSENDFSVSPYDGGKSLRITGYKGSKRTVSIPPKINGVPVTSIGDSAFSNQASLARINIPNSVTSIGNEAFYRCTSLTRITTRNSITSIGNYAFYGCTSLPSVNIPNSVTSIGNYAFSGCAGLTSVTIGRSVARIGDLAFSYCDDLTSVIIGRAVTRIGDLAFYGGTSLASVTFQSTIASNNLNSSAFPGDLHSKFYAGDETNGTPGMFTRNPTKDEWIKQ
jgi:hypothetical protein